MTDDRVDQIAARTYWLIWLALLIVTIYGPGCLPPYNPTPSPTPEVSPSASPSTTPEPSPTTTPSPAPTATPSVAPCSVPAMPECGAGGGHDGPWGCCHKPDGSRYQDVVSLAVAATGVTTVTDPDAFRDAVISILERGGYCAVKGGPGDEIGVKLRNDYSEQYDVIRSDGAPMALHAATCEPARF